MFAQVKQTKSALSRRNSKEGVDSLSNKRAKDFKKLAKIDMYLLLNAENDSTIVDTTLSIKKDYKFNYLQRDNFGLMPFANIGQTYNSLTYSELLRNSLPLFGARARHHNYLVQDDIKYYEVPTPWTRLTFKSAFEQGQMLDAFFTVNLAKQFNFSLAYKGLRSLGNYQNALTSSGNFRFTTNYKTKNGRYKAKAHIVMQDLLNQENGGLKDVDVVNFQSGDNEFKDRSVFNPNFENAENVLEGKQFFLNHTFDIVKKKDSLSKNQLKISNTVSLEDKFYQYTQTSSVTSFFGDAFTNSINDKVTLEDFRAQLGVNYINNILGDLEFGINYTNFNYGYNNVVLLGQELIPNRIKSNFFGLTASYSKTIKAISLKGRAGLNLSNDYSGNYINAAINFNLSKDFALSGALNISSRLPNFNYLLYQSDYINYNWYNLNAYKNINTQQLNFNIKSKKIFNATLDIYNIDNYTYFNHNNTIDQVKVIKPTQYNNALQYVKLKIQKEFKLGNFALDNTIMYQNVVSDQDVLNMPTFISRNTLYYSNQVFKKAMTLQTGVTLNYFTKYKMNGYDPLLAEFYTQNETELGGFPRLDFFVNAKVRQTRIFFKAEHFNSSFTGYDYFSAPNHPYRDFTLRFGIVWDFFL